jgi:hypothetical protein
VQILDCHDLKSRLCDRIASNPNISRESLINAVLSDLDVSLKELVDDGVVVHELDFWGEDHLDQFAIAMAVMLNDELRRSARLKTQ